MSDLIDRQAAIDAAIEATDSWEGFCSIGRQKRIENYINSLPFAPGMDCISRRAAIDICANVIDLFREQFGAGVLVVIKESIEKLPSAQLGTNLAEVGTDCISRQDAIDALRNYLVGKNVPCDGTMMARLIENEVISKLPSAQPVRCKDCKSYQLNHHYCSFHRSEFCIDDFCSYAERREDGKIRSVYR